MSAPRTRRYRATTQRDWFAYEAHKAEWISKNPRSTPKEYEAAIKAIVKRLGV